MDPTERKKLAIALIVEERNQQDVKWGPLEEHISKSQCVWHLILSEETGEVAREVLEGRFRVEGVHAEKLINELAQVGAVATAWIETLIEKRDRKRIKP